MNRNIFVILILAVLFVSCSDVLDPSLENNQGKNTTYVNPNFGYSLIVNGYDRVPLNNWSFNDVATDDAVTNDPSNNYLKMATGQLTSSNNAVDMWTNCNTGIQYMNIFISEVNKMKFTEDAQGDMMYKDRMRGEAYGLRALLMYHLLRAHAGWVNGKLLGFPIFLTEQASGSNFNLPRADFNTCMTQIYQDLDSAKSLLPTTYTDITSTGIPAKYVSAGITDYTKYNRVFGVKFLGLMSGLISQAVRAQAALLAASPAFNDGSANGSNGTWETAAVAAAQIINLKGGIAGFPAYPAAWFTNGTSWYNNSAEISSLNNGTNPPEMLWREGIQGANNTLETNNFPPSLNGNGRINPTENLVEAFPDKNGYPITNTASVYSSANPYANRDPRLLNYIVVHGSKAGVPNVPINIASGNDAVNNIATSTRTGYYMRKLLRQDVNKAPNINSTQIHYVPKIRYTEIYLIYAEAANEAWGPLADPKGYGYSAYDVIKAIRKRALGIATDPYLESIKSDPAAMRQLIHNERRLELCFEGFRFWDLRRWKVTLPELSAPALGITVTGTTSAYTISTPATVETRQYNDKKYYYGPVPYGETVKWSNLLQNDGW
ncbi:RagB/SusD domain protein [Paludibacter propionicigenes WB4]|uniref:RagB/SusD domain protein n=1 Tax=Paludibacter propionicigenes (strain DSM 17365 / JCM 13257 / WB4) TaxID=694427 RepID=E4T1K5_PALPW|nr:RagB/SusD family nutrient uptake outer membrane protein [Paludibacter propionicigenes]ADQ78599.1 RagB/SusD domain protein [Paludibacter propionicigenes WB4]